MNKTLYPILATACLCLSLHVLAQQEPITSTTQNGYFDTENRIAVDDIDAYEVLFTQFSELPDFQKITSLKKLGVSLLEFIGNKTYLAIHSKNITSAQLIAHGIVRRTELDTEQKLSEDLISNQEPDWAINKGRLELILKYYHCFHQKDIISQCEKNGIKILSANDRNNYLKVSIDSKRLLEIANLSYIEFLQPIPPPSIPDDIKGRSLHRANVLDASFINGRHYDGSGVGVLCRDDGFVGPHIDFKGRIRNDFVDNQNNLGGMHGDGVSGILSGAGNLNPANKGIASGSELFVLNYQADFLDETLDLHIENGVLVTNSSYSNGCNGGYTAITATVDQQLYEFPSLMHVFSAGNSNGQACGYGAGNQWGNITGGHKQSKNCITTANLDAAGNLQTTSSRGPASDGRIKPDIAANGEGQISTSSNNDYQEFGGTSAAAPVIAGILAQLHQAYRALNNNATAPAALLKACLLNTAKDLGNPGPDFQFGWGQANALKALQCLENGHYLSNTATNGQINTHLISVPSGTRKLNIMLYWADREASQFASKALVNDLELKAIAPDGVNYLPWILNAAPDSTALNSPATKGTDHLNNMEQITIESPNEGNYQIEVVGFEVPFGVHDYFLVWDFINDDIELTYPNGGESITPGETIRIHWEASSTHTSFDLAYSFDGGANFEHIAEVAGSVNMYDWSVPEQSTSELMIKVSSSNLNSFCTNHKVVSIAAVPQNLSITQACHDYLKLNWSAVEAGEYQDSLFYEVFMMGEKYMESIGTTYSTEFEVPTIFQDPTNDHWLAVKSHSKNGFHSERSVAILYNHGLLNCTATDDLEIISIDTPQEGFLFGCGTNDTQVAITFKNNGLYPQNELSFGYVVNGSDPVIENISFDLLPGQTANYVFDTHLDLVGSSAIQLKVFTMLSGDEIHFNDTITLNFSAALYPGDGETLPYSESFDNSTTLPPYFALENPDGYKTWEKIDVVGTNNEETSCYYMDNFFYSSSGEVDGLLVVPIDLYAMENPILTFDVAYAQYSNAFSDGLRIEISDDCGATFNKVIYEKFGTDLATMEDQSSPFYPSKGADWRQEEISLKEFSGNSIVLKFNNICGYGNSLFIDNVKIENQSIFSPSFSIQTINLCIGQPIVFQNESAGQYESINWNFGDDAIPQNSSSMTSTSVIFSSPGLHEVKLTLFGSGFSTTISQWVDIVPLPKADFYHSIDGATVTLNNTSKNATKLLWDFGDGVSSEWLNPVHTYESQGWFQIALTASNACGEDNKLSEKIQIILSDSSETTKLPKVKIAPNPIGNEFNLALENYDEGEVMVKVIDLSGKIRMQNRYHELPQKSKLLLDSSSLHAGIYFLEVKNKRWCRVLKLLKE